VLRGTRPRSGGALGRDEEKKSSKVSLLSFQGSDRKWWGVALAPVHLDAPGIGIDDAPVSEMTLRA
jgi:hypothetical protein